MFKIVTKYILALSTIFLLSACSNSDQITNQGGQSSFNNRVTTYQYTIPESIKTQIEQNTEKIIITELVSDATLNASEEVITNIASYINSVNKAMIEQGYTIISSDTNSMDNYGRTIVVTLIFENIKN